MKCSEEVYNFNFSASRPPAIILGGYVNGLGLARGLGEAGVSSIVVDYKRNIASRSKYVVSELISPHPAEKSPAFVAFMANLGRRLETKGVLFCTNDIWLIPISKSQRQLEAYYHYPMSEWDVIESCTNKTQLYQLAQTAGVPYPHTFFLQSVLELPKYASQLVFPCVIKPAVTVGFSERLGVSGRTLVIKDAQSLNCWERRIIESDLVSTPLLIQALIPGGTECLYTLTAYSNRQGEILAYSTGHKIRQSPAEAGTIVSGHVVPEYEVFHWGQKLIRAAGFYGLSNTEFKKDTRDGQFKLIEINPRPGMWNYSATATGVNLPYMCYREALGEVADKLEAVDTEVIWLLPYPDLITATQECKLSLRQWLLSVNGKKIDAVFQFRDLLPGICYYWMIFKSAIVKALKAFRSWF